MKLMERVGLHEDLCKELTTVYGIIRVVAAIADNQIILNTTAALDSSQIRINNILEGLTSKLIVDFKELGLGSITNCSFNHQEQSTNVDTIEGGRCCQSSFVSEENNTFTREGDDRVNSGSVQSVTLIFERRVCKATAFLI